MPAIAGEAAHEAGIWKPMNAGVVATGCLSYPSLTLLAQLYNRAKPAGAPAIPVKRTRAAMRAAIDARLVADGACSSGDEACWVRQPFATESAQVKRVVNAAFKPVAPRTWDRNKNEWLSNEDIEKVMKQYEAADPKFKFYGCFPIDFGSKLDKKHATCVSEEICHLNLKRERASGRTRLGFVFNTDKHTGGGQHWIAAYVGMDPKDKNFGVYYYDSVAKAVPPQIARFVANCREMLKDLVGRTRVPVHTNSVRKQFKGTECGIFVMLFLASMRSVRFSRICEDMGTDDEVEAFRSVFFRREKGDEKGKGQKTQKTK